MSIENQANEQKDNEQYSKNFARIPNMLFVSFKHLTKEEKFLYCTLKSIYWDSKPRFVSLRSLVDVTGYSRSALSSMLPRLHKCGLINVDVKREKDRDGNETGNAKHQVTILDIWELNRLYFSSSPDDREKLDPSLELVREKGQDYQPKTQNLSAKKAKPVRETSQDCSPNKPSLSAKKAKTTTSTQLVEQFDGASKENDKDKKTNKERTNNSPSISLSPDVSKFSMEEKTLLSWLKEDDVITSNDNDKVKVQLQKLAPLAKTKEDVHDHFLFTQKMVNGRGNPAVSLGNMVEDSVLNTLRQTRKQEPEQVTPSTTVHDQNGMGKEDAEDMLYNNMLQMYPTLITSVVEGQGLYFIGIAKGENDWIDICNPRDWYHLPEEDIDQALAYSSDVSAIAV